ncbi:MAG: GNAT family N-acetyltransferase [Lachnospiraceae bacterium]
MIEKSKIEIVHKITAEEFIDLRRTVDFQPLTHEEAKQVLEHTSYVTVIRYEEKVIGLIRLLFDYGTDAYITDVIVNPKYQGYGLGRMLVEDVVKYVENHSFSGVKVACSLYANKGKENFYGKMGFSSLPDEKYGHGMLMEV